MFKIQNLYTYLNKSGFKKEAAHLLKFCTLEKKAFLLPYLLSMLTGCRKEHVIPGDFELFSLSDRISYDEAKSKINLSDYENEPNDLFGQINNMLSMLEDRFEEGVYKTLELGPNYMHEKEIPETEDSIGDIIGTVQFKVQFSCIPKASHITYSIDGEEEIVIHKNSYYGSVAKDDPVHTNSPSTPATIRPDEDSVEYNYKYNPETGNLEEPFDTYAIVVRFTYIKILDEQYIQFNNIDVIWHEAAARCERNSMP